MKLKFISSIIGLLGTALLAVDANAGGFVDLRTGTTSQLCAPSRTAEPTLRCFSLANQTSDPLYLAPTLQNGALGLPSSLNLISKVDTSFTAAEQSDFTGVFSDYVFIDKGTNSVVIGSRLYFPPIGNFANKSEVNDIFRTGYAGFNVQAAWTAVDPNDKLPVSVALTDSGFKQADRFNANVVDFRTDVNASETKPTSGLFLIRTDATAFKVINNAVSLRQGGEEGQKVLTVNLAGYAPTKLDGGVGSGETVKMYGGSYTSSMNVGGNLSVEYGNAQFSGAVIAANGSHINAQTGTTATFNGAFNQQVGADLGGGGTFVFNGGYSPGNSPGSVTINADTVFGTSNEALFEIAGLAQGTQYDHLNVNGNLTFGGTLKLSFINGYTGNAGDTFDLFDWTTSTGTFASISTQNASLGSGLAWNFDHLYTNGTISVIATTSVPEPESYALLMVGLGVIGAMARRKKK